MSLAFYEAFPAISPMTVAVGCVYAHANSFLVSTPVFKALYEKANSTRDAEKTAKSPEARSAAVTWSTSLASSAAQSYGVAALLKLANATSYKASAIVGALLMAVNTGPQLVSAVLIQKQPIDVVLSQMAVASLNTIGLALTLTWASGNPALERV